MLGWMAFSRLWPAPGSAHISRCQGGHSAFLSVRWSWPSRQRQWPGAKTIKKNTNSTQNKYQTHHAKQYEVTSFLSTDCELSTETCSKNVYSLGPWSFDDFILLDTSACSRNVLFAFTSFSPAAFPITNNLDVSITPPGRHVLLDFVPYQINSACRFHIYSLNCRYLQLICRYLQLNWRYLQIGLIVDISNWIADISKWIVDIFKWIVDIYNSIEDIYNSFGDISKYCLFGDIYNWIVDIYNSFEDIYNSFEDISK